MVTVPGAGTTVNIPHEGRAQHVPRMPLNTDGLLRHQRLLPMGRCQQQKHLQQMAEPQTQTRGGTIDRFASRQGQGRVLCEPDTATEALSRPPNRP